MKRFTSILFLSLSFYCIESIQMFCKPINANNNIAIVGAYVIPMGNDTILSSKTVLIENGIIVKIIDVSDTIPPGFNKVNASGKYLLPGLCDMHIHLRDPDEFNSYLRYGITSVLQMSSSQSQLPVFKSYQVNIKNGSLIAPNFYFTSPLVEGENPSHPNISISIRSENDIDAFIALCFKSEFDFIKMYETIDSTLYFSLLQKAKQHNIYVIGHTPRNVSPASVLESGIKMIAHSEEFFFDFFNCRNCDHNNHPDTSKIQELTDLLLKENIFVTPNLSFVYAIQKALLSPEELWKDAEVKFLPPAVYDTWQSSNPNRRKDLEKFKERESIKYPFLQNLVKRMYDSGIPLLTGTDAALFGLSPGKSIIEDILELKKCGISNYGCIEAATKHPGYFLYSFSKIQPQEKFGLIKEGFRADMIILEENPLDNLDNLYKINSVILRGRIFSREELDAKRKIYREN